MECFKWDLMGYPNKNMDDFVAGSDLNCGDLAKEFSVGKIFRMWLTDCGVLFCFILVKNVTTLCPSLKSITESKVLITLAKAPLKAHQRLCFLV